MDDEGCARWMMTAEGRFDPVVNGGGKGTGLKQRDEEGCAGLKVNVFVWRVKNVGVARRRWRWRVEVVCWNVKCW